jgi:CTP synthase
MHCGKKLEIIWIDAEDLEFSTRATKPTTHYKAWAQLTDCDGILVPGGFGERGIEGMILTAKHAREEKKPYLGICLGMQIAVIEYARHICGVEHARSEEIKEATGPKVIVHMPEIDKTTMGANMRLGLRPTLFQPGSEWSKLRQLYGESSEILERHRHRYEVNPEYVDQFEKAGLNFVGKDDKGERMEIVELKDHPWYVGVQFHPEYLSRVLDPSKPYLGFVAAAAKVLDKVTAKVNSNGADALVNGLDGVRI